MLVVFVLVGVLCSENRQRVRLNGEDLLLRGSGISRYWRDDRDCNLDMCLKDTSFIITKK